jgi:hypothetical protein
MNGRIRRMYRTDMTVIVVFMAGMWVVLAFILRELLGLVDLLPAESMKLGDGANPAAIKAIVAASAMAAGTLATAALAAVLLQLRRNRDSLYAEDIMHLDNAQ